MNFDAETSQETLEPDSYGKVYDLGVQWSETFQASSSGTLVKRSALIRRLLKKFGKRFSANLVVGNQAYGLHPSYELLHHMTHRIAPLSNMGLKLGAEGLLNGKRAIDLALETGSTAYILHTTLTNQLVQYAREKNARFTVYTLCRIGESRARAASELMHIKGTNYFERRNVLREEISQRLGEFAIFGTGEDVASQVRALLCQGASKVVLFPVFCGTRDLISQLNMLADWIE